ncbi:MAG: TerB family tellurite resistance protein [FCB group bacterium]|nr:TerB family tellurite resistance protein [FCB group bacterium]
MQSITKLDDNMKRNLVTALTEITAADENIDVLESAILRTVKVTLGL